MKTRYVILPAVFFLLFNAGCGNKQAVPAQAGQAGVSISTGTVTDFIPDVGKYGTVAECPVNKEKVVVGKGTAAVKYKDKVYYMCCPMCAQQFKQNPEKYMNVD